MQEPQAPGAVTSVAAHGHALDDRDQPDGFAEYRVETRQTRLEEPQVWVLLQEPFCLKVPGIGSKSMGIIRNSMD